MMEQSGEETQEVQQQILDQNELQKNVNVKANPQTDTSKQNAKYVIERCDQILLNDT